MYTDSTCSKTWNVQRQHKQEDIECTQTAQAVRHRMYKGSTSRKTECTQTAKAVRCRMHTSST